MFSSFKWFLLLLVIAISLTIIGISYQNKQVNSITTGYIVFIDPGHGGKDNGTSNNEVLEDEINLDIAKLIYNKLIDKEIMVIITRTGDYDLSDMYAKNHKLMDLNKRIEHIKSFKTDLFVSIHLNSYPSDNVSGAQVFYKNKLEKSYNLALILQKNLNILNTKDKKPKVGDYYLLNNTDNINGVIVECGFLSNEEETKKLLTFDYQDKIATIIVNSICEYLS